MTNEELWAKVDDLLIGRHGGTRLGDWVERAEREYQAARSVVLAFAHAEDTARHVLHEAQQQLADYRAAWQTARENLLQARLELHDAEQELGRAVAREVTR